MLSSHYELRHNKWPLVARLHEGALASIRRLSLAEIPVRATFLFFLSGDVIKIFRRTLEWQMHLCEHVIN